MDERLILTAEQLVELTDRQRAAAQVRRLKAMGVPFLWDGHGSVKVLRSALEHQAAKRAARQGYWQEPDFSIFGKR